MRIKSLPIIALLFVTTLSYAKSPEFTVTDWPKTTKAQQLQQVGDVLSRFKQAGVQINRPIGFYVQKINYMMQHDSDVARSDTPLTVLVKMLAQTNKDYKYDGIEVNGFPTGFDGAAPSISKEAMDRLNKSINSSERQAIQADIQDISKENRDSIEMAQRDVILTGDRIGDKPAVFYLGWIWII
jgi:hypothetical protein